MPKYHGESPYGTDSFMEIWQFKFKYKKLFTKLN